ncbi:uncharacterized protein LOC110812318 [Carica papaya]|uniref:uncharacterized protein LOC110812318 n=1 Tax=Carica papaya TaxID=3649 RepID=UPI000B8D06E4|nr:uncharacterized protein LOC110812318 [Carica papaya]
MAAWTAVARQAPKDHLHRLCFPKSPSTTQAASLFQRRGLAGGADHHGSLKVNFWEDPLHPSKWKQEQFVTVSLAGWGLLAYGGYKYFTKNTKDEEKEKVGGG